MKQRWKQASVLLMSLLSLLVWVGPSIASPAPEMQPVNIGNPRIDLQAVEQALQQTKASRPTDFRGWMQMFEDEVNAIYFATLRRQYPQADPATLMPKPARVDAQWNNRLLFLYGYIDQNNIQGFQHGQDLLLFVFEQTKAYDASNRRASYALRDGDGYYYRDADYSYTWGAGVNPYFTGFFIYPTIWAGTYWRPAFVWWGTPYWNNGFFYSRYNYYYGLYPRYANTYRSTYYVRYRPWGWRRGTFFRGNGGKYYYRSRQWATTHRQMRSSYRGYVRQRQQARQRQRTWNKTRSRWHRQHRPQNRYRNFRRQPQRQQYRRPARRQTRQPARPARRPARSGGGGGGRRRR